MDVAKSAGLNSPQDNSLKRRLEGFLFHVNDKGAPLTPSHFEPQNRGPENMGIYQKRTKKIFFDGFY